VTRPVAPPFRAQPRLSAVLLAGAIATTPSWMSTATAQTPPTRAASVPALAAEEGPRWAELSAQERTALEPLAREWSRIGAGHKAKWREMAARLPAMNPEQRERVGERMTEWARLTPEQRGRARLQYQEVKRAAPEDRRAQWEAYQSLPSEARKQLADRAATQASAAALAARRPAANIAANGTNTAPAPKTKTSQTLPPSPPAKAVAPTVVRAADGATTSLVSRTPTPPLHQQVGLPKIAATPGFVDKSTLLPQRGAQGAAMQTSGLQAGKDAPAP
jgi:hypothetical protein